MPFPECKVYYDGSHYIAIPHTEGIKGKRKKYVEPLIDLRSEEDKEKEKRREEYKMLVDIGLIDESDEGAENTAPIPSCEKNESSSDQSNKLDLKERLKQQPMTRKELFEELYRENINVKKKQRKEIIVKAMLPCFTKEEYARAYVDAQFERKKRNLICRRQRIVRKIKLHLHDFNYFATFTYADGKHSEDSFKKKLIQCFWNFTKRKDWQYVGVWERAPKTNRLHFHGLMAIPDGTMPGEIIEVNDWDSKRHRRQITFQNTYFNELFGRSDFKELDDDIEIGRSIAYIIKYIEKTGEKIVSSKGLSQYFISDILDEDIIIPCGREESPKFILVDNFHCFDEGVYMGTVSPDVIKKMRKAN